MTELSFKNRITEFAREHSIIYPTIAFLVPFVIYALSLRYYDYTYGFNVLATQYALFFHHSLSVGTPAGTIAPGTIPNIDIILYNGNYYVAYAPGLIFLSFPFSIVGFILDGGKLLPQGNAIVILELFLALCGSLASFLTYKICLIYSSRVPALLAAMVLAFGTSAWPFASVVFPHDATMLFVLAATYCIVYYFRRVANTLLILIAGVCLGVASSTDYISTLLIVPVVGYLIFGGIMNQAARTQYTVARFGEGKESRRIPYASTSSTAIPLDQNPSLESLARYSNEDHSFNRLSMGELILFIVLFVLTGPLVILGYNYTIFRNPFTFPEEFFTYVPSPQQSLGGLEGRFDLMALPAQAIYNLFSLYRGLLILSPVLIFGFYGLYLMISKYRNLRPDALFFLALFLTIFLPYSAWSQWTGGASYGPRFLVTSLPYLVIPMCIVFAIWKGSEIRRGIKSAVASTVLYALFGISMFTQGIGALTTATPHLIAPPPLLTYQPSVEAIPDLFTGKYGLWWMYRLNMIGNVADTLTFTVILFGFILGLVGYLLYRNIKTTE